MFIHQYLTDNKYNNTETVICNYLHK